MILKDLRKLLDRIPLESDNFELLNGEMAMLDVEDKESVLFRVDKPIVMIRVEDKDGEIIFLHQTEEDISNLINHESKS